MRSSRGVPSRSARAAPAAFALLGALAIALVAAAATAATYVVRPDGTGDFPTIQAAVDAVLAGDTIELADGVFAGEGNRDVDYLGKAIVIRSQSGNAESCTVDCGGSAESGHRGFRLHAGEPAAAMLANITVTGGWVTEPPYGGAVACELGSSPTLLGCHFTGNRDAAIAVSGGSAPSITGCRFAGNHALEGGAITCLEASPTIEGCDFVDNTAEWSGGAYYGYATGAAVTDCRFVGNQAIDAGAMMCLAGGTVAITDCLFDGNIASQCGGAAYFFCFLDATIVGSTFTGNSAMRAGGLATGKMTTARLERCTFWGNAATFGSALSCDQDRPVTLDNTIIAFATAGEAIHCESDVTLSCCDVYGNAGGDWVGGIAGQQGMRGNMQADPLFCDAPAGDLRLDECSPCAPEHSGDCGLIGAWAVGCGPVAITPASWGAVKSSFR